MTDTIHDPTTTTRTGTPRRGCETKLRTVLRINAGVSLVTGGLLAVAPHRIDELLDTGHPGWVRIVGLGLLPFAAFYGWVAAGSVATMRRATPWIIAGDLAWVVASVATALAGWYSGGGIVAVLAMAAVVDSFALLQWSAWRQLPGTR